MDCAANMQKPATLHLKKTLGWEPLIFLIAFLGVFCAIGQKMGVIHMLNTIMNTAFDLLLHTVFYIMAISVVAGAVAELLNEFGITAVLNRFLSPLIRPIYGLPGAAIVGIFACFFSDNPAILTLADSKSFRRYFKKYQIAPLTNIGTSFGMGLIVIAFMIGTQPPDGGNFVLATAVGFLGAVIGSIVSTRLMIRHTKKIFGTEEMAVESDEAGQYDMLHERVIREGNAAERFLSALLEGGKTGVKLGFEIIPGVLIICSFVMLLTFSAPVGGYTGAAYEGIGLLPWAAGKLEFLLKPLFGFTSAEAISVPITALGAAGAAISLVPKLVADGLVGGNDIAVFTATCMCWSGYLSTHIAMLEGLGFRKLSGKSILYHTLGGLAAGISANWIYRGMLLLL